MPVVVFPIPGSWLLYELVRSNVGVETVRVLAGHEDLRTTQRYLHSERSDLTEAMETFSNDSRRLAVSSK